MGRSVIPLFVYYIVLTLVGTVRPGFALTPMSDDALSQTHAASGIRFDIDSLYLNYRADELGWIAHENLPGYWGSTTTPYWDPTDADYRYAKLYGRNVFAEDIKVDGSLTIGFGAYKIPDQVYAVRDTWKQESGSASGKTQKYVHDFTNYTLSGVSPEFNESGRDVLKIELFSSSDYVVETGAMGGGFYADYSSSGNTESSADETFLGDFGAEGVKLIDQQMILYPINEIPMQAGASSLYAEGEGLAFELGLRISIDSLCIKSPGYTLPSGAGSLPESEQGDLVLKGIHLREAFNDTWLQDAYGPTVANYPAKTSQYDFLGKVTTIGSGASGLYEFSTGDAGGYNYDEGDDSNLLSAQQSILAAWRAKDPSSSKLVDNLYGGRFMMGNLAQVDFSDHISGNGEIPFHIGHGNQISEDEMLDDDNDKQDGEIGGVKIVERPSTLSFITREDGSTCLAMNLPMHGSIRVEEVIGYNSSGDDTYLGGNSMGPVIVEGLRIKKLYIEFPGRGEEYTLNTTYFPKDGASAALYPYTYRAGQLPTPQVISDNQHPDDSMGRGVAWVMDRLAPQAEGIDSLPGGLADQYVTRVGGTAFGQGMSYWRIVEHAPNNSNNYTTY